MRPFYVVSEELPEKKNHKQKKPISIQSPDVSFPSIPVGNDHVDQLHDEKRPTRQARKYL